MKWFCMTNGFGMYTSQAHIAQYIKFHAKNISRY